MMRLGAAVVVVGAVLAEAVGAQCAGPDKMGPPIPFSDRRFGASIATDGDLLVVGAPRSFVVDDIHEEGSVAVYRMIAGEWLWEARLVASDPEDDDYFGQAVAVSGDTVLVGAPRKEDFGANTGAAYTFRFVGSEWVFEQKVLAADPQYSSMFGAAVELEGDLAVISSPAKQQGLVHAFRRQNGLWSQVQVFSWDGLTQSASFGRALDLHDGELFVGAMFDGQSPLWVGRVLLYGWNGTSFTLSSTLQPPDMQAGANFGSAVAFDGDVLVVGASGYDLPGKQDAGLAHVYRRVGTVWTLDATLESGDTNYIGNFGATADVEGDLVVVGEPGDRFDPDVMNSGALWRFVPVGSEWVQQPKLVPLDVFEWELFGSAVAVRGDDVIGGAPGEGSIWINPGAIHTFHGPPAWSSLGHPLGGTLGLPKLTADLAFGPATTVQLLAQQLKPGGSASLVLGLQQLDLPFHGGVLVPSPDVIMAGLPVEADGTLCLQGTLVGSLPSGLPLYLQVWVKDSKGLHGFAASGAVQIVAP